MKTRLAPALLLTLGVLSRAQAAGPLSMGAGAARSGAPPMFAPIAQAWNQALNPLILNTDGRLSSTLIPQLQTSNLQEIQRQEVVEALARALIAAEVSPEQVATLAEPEHWEQALRRGQTRLFEALDAQRDMDVLDESVLALQPAMPVYILLFPDQAKASADSYFAARRRVNDSRAREEETEIRRIQGLLEDRGGAKTDVTGVGGLVDAEDARARALKTGLNMGDSPTGFDPTAAAHAAVDDRPLSEQSLGALPAVPKLDLSLFDQRVQIQARRLVRARNQARGLVALLFQFDEAERGMKADVITPLRDLVSGRDDERLQLIAVRGLGRYLARTKEYADETLEAMSEIVEGSGHDAVQQAFAELVLDHISGKDPRTKNLSSPIRRVGVVAALSTHLEVKVFTAQRLIAQFQRYRGNEDVLDHKESLLDAAIQVAKSALQDDRTEGLKLLRLIAQAIAAELQAYEEYGSDYDKGLLKRLDNLVAVGADEALQDYIVQQLLKSILVIDDPDWAKIVTETARDIKAGRGQATAADEGQAAAADAPTAGQPQPSDERGSLLGAVAGVLGYTALLLGLLATGLHQAGPVATAGLIASLTLLASLTALGLRSGFGSRTFWHLLPLGAYLLTVATKGFYPAHVTAGAPIGSLIEGFLVSLPIGIGLVIIPMTGLALTRGSWVSRAPIRAWAVNAILAAVTAALLFWPQIRPWINTAARGEPDRAVQAYDELFKRGDLKQ